MKLFRILGHLLTHQWGIWENMSRNCQDCSARQTDAPGGTITEWNNA